MSEFSYRLRSEIEYKKSIDISIYLQYRELLDDIAILSTETLEPIKAVVKSFANSERKKKIIQ